ncbi:MAG: GDSL-type esterase/lipase family protein [Acidobacteriota bacterium]
MEETKKAKMSLPRKIANGVFLGVLLLIGLELLLRLIGVVVAHSIQGSGGDGPAGAFHIVALGDSWTEGRDDGRYPEFLEEALNRRGDGTAYRVTNLGRSGTNSSQAARLLAEQWGELQPDLLIVWTGNNDHHNLTDSTYWRFEDGSLGTLSILEARMRIFIHSIRVYRLGRQVYRAVSGQPTTNVYFYRETSDAQSSSRDVAIDRETHRRQLEYNLTRIVEMARNERIPVVFATYFHFHGYHVNEIIRDVASSYSVPLVDNNLLFHERIAVEDRPAYLVPDGHPNPRGYRFIVDNILRVLDGNELLPSSP